MNNAKATTLAANQAVIDKFKASGEIANPNNELWQAKAIRYDILQLALLNEALEECEVQATADRIEEVSLGLRNRIEFKLLCQSYAFFRIEKDLHTEPAHA